MLSAAVPQFVSLLLMRTIFSQNGIVNTLLLNHHIIDNAIPFWSNATIARIMVIVINIWIGIPFTIMQVTGILQSIPEDIYEAAKVDGAGPVKIFFKITLLQMIKRVVPPMSNEIITLVKDTSLARIIAAYELTFAGAAFMKSDGLTWPLFYTGVFYLIFIGILTLLFGYIERKLDYFK